MIRADPWAASVVRGGEFESGVIRLWYTLIDPARPQVREKDGPTTPFRRPAPRSDPDGPGLVTALTSADRG
jgi:hypothetical protein